MDRTTIQQRMQMLGRELDTAAVDAYRFQKDAETVKVLMRVAAECQRMALAEWEDLYKRGPVD